MSSSESLPLEVRFFRGFLLEDLDLEVILLVSSSDLLRTLLDDRDLEANSLAAAASSSFFLNRLRSSRAAAMSGLLLLREGALRCLDLDLVRRRVLASSERLLPGLDSSLCRSSGRNRRLRVRGDRLEDFFTFFL